MTFNSIADEFESVRLDLQGMRNKYLETDVAAMQAEIASQRSEIDKLRQAVDAISFELAALRDDVASSIDRSAGKVVALR